MSALLELTGLGKSFFGVAALAGVSLDVARGEVLGLIGENGAGKSTLMNIVGGVLPPSAGRMVLDGQPYQPRSPADASRHGIAFIHQELNLFGNLTVAENLFIDGFPRRFGLIDRPAMARRAKEVLDSLDLAVRPGTLIADLSPGERQMAEIAKALHQDARLIIFDEPTSSLTARETEQLFATIRRLRERGTTMIYISHILSEVLALSDRIGVLRDGELVGIGPRAGFDVDRMITLMIGRHLEQLYPPRTGTPGEEIVLEVRGLSQPGVIEDIGFQVRRGEVVGLFGLMGSGRTELARILFGLDSFASGEIVLRGRRLERHSPGRRIRDGMAFVTENRREEGLMMESTIADNLALVALRRYVRGLLGLVDPDRQAEATRGIAAGLQIKAGDIHRQLAKSLSGGNQQKVVLGKWLLSEPAMFILDEPTRGVDVGAKYEIYGIVDQLAAAGNSVLFISSELEELMGMCDRILVMGHGALGGVFDQRPFVMADLLRAAFREEVAA